MSKFPWFIYSIILLIYSYVCDFEFFCFLLVFIIFHFNKGLISIVNDYIYFNLLKIIFIFLVRISSLQLIRFFFEFLF